MFRYSILAVLVLTMTFSMSSASHAMVTSRATVCVVDTNGIPIDEFQIRLMKITGKTAHDTGHYKTGFQSEKGAIITPEVDIKNKQGLVNLENLEIGHYQICVRADRYRMQPPKWYFSQVILQRDDVLNVHPDSGVAENEESGSVWMLTHHFDIVAGETTNVNIIMVPIWTLHGAVAFSDDTSLPLKKVKELFSLVRCRYDGPGGNAPFYLDENGGFVISGTGTGNLKVSIGKPIGAADKVPWEHVVSIQVDPHGTYILPEVLVEKPAEEDKSNKTN